MYLPPTPSSTACFTTPSALNHLRMSYQPSHSREQSVPLGTTLLRTNPPGRVCYRIILEKSLLYKLRRCCSSLFGVFVTLALFRASQVDRACDPPPLARLYTCGWFRYCVQPYQRRNLGPKSAAQRNFALTSKSASPRESHSCP